MNSGTAARETIRVQTAELGKHRRLTSGGADIFQLRNEVRACSPGEPEQILSELHSGGFKVEVPDTRHEGGPQHTVDQASGSEKVHIIALKFIGLVLGTCMTIL